MFAVSNNLSKVQLSMERLGAVISRWPWSLGFCLFSLFMALEYVVLKSAMLVVGVPLVVFNCYSWALLARRFQGVRPPAWVVSLGTACCVGGHVVWAVSVFLTVTVVAGPTQLWTLGDAAFKREVYSMCGQPRFAEVPKIDVHFHVARLPVLKCGPSISMGHAAGGSSRGVEWSIWGFAVSSGLPTLVLSHLRKRRVRPDSCSECDYDLTGNVTGVCPECGVRRQIRDRGSAG